MLVLFMASIHGFTHVVYPLIPPERGGGNYLHGTVVDVCMRSPDVLNTGFQYPDSKVASTADFCASGILLQDLIVLEEDADTIYLASIYDRGMYGPIEEGNIPRNCGLEAWHVGTNAPHVISIREEALLGAHDKDTVEHFCRALQNQAASPKQLPGSDRATPE